MTTVLAEPLFDRSTPRSSPEVSTPPATPEGDGGEGAGPTLGDLVSGAWEGLGASATVACPVCGGEMRPRDTASARPAGGRCTDCGTELS